MNRHLVFLASVGVFLSTSVGAQTLDKPLQLASREPAFYAIVGSHIERAEVHNVAVLRTHIALSLHNATIPDALSAIEEQTPLRFVFKPSILPRGASVSLDASDITVAAALTQILLDADVDVEISPYGLTSIVPRVTSPSAATAQTGTITGRVVDEKNRHPVSYANVMLEETGRSTTTGDSGTFRMANVPAGKYTVVVRRLGYLAWRHSVVITADETVDLESVLQASANKLDAVVVTGTLVSTAVKEIPTPISVVSDSDIAQEHPRDIQEIIRHFVPTAVSFDNPVAPYATGMSVRGATNLSNGGTMKVIIDGIETTDGAASPIDPQSIERIEVVRGPEAAAIYGSGAIDGVVQIFTKRGDPNSPRPHVDLEIGAADLQTPYAGFHDVLRQTYSGDVRGGTENATYNLGGGYTQTNNYIPNGEFSALSAPSVHGGISYTRGVASLDLGARYYSLYAPQAFNPRMFDVGYAPLSKPSWASDQYTYETVGTTLTIRPEPWWRNAFTFGIDQNNSDNIQRKPRFTTPTDSELTYSYTSATKTSLAFNSSITGVLAPHIDGTLTVGADHWTLPEVSTGSYGVYNVSGALNTDSLYPFQNVRTVTTNSGVFAQAQIGLFDELFLTGGARAEWNTDWGDSIGVPISPRVGASFVHDLGPMSLKLRASWGSALIPPPPGQNLTIITPTSIVLGNPHLGPEHQRGGDAGFDLVFGGHGSFGATYYNQTAVNLIEVTTLPSDTIQTIQSENVGTIKNTGVELEGTLNAWRLSMRGVFGYSRSRVDQLIKGYQGDLRIGDQVFDMPKITGGASMAMRLWSGAAATAGLTYVGSWTDYDYLHMYACQGELGAASTPACPPQYLQTFSNRLFLIKYPALIKGNVSATQQVNAYASVYISVENIGDDQGYEPNNVNPVFGRITTFGIRLHY